MWAGILSYLDYVWNAIGGMFHGRGLIFFLCAACVLGVLLLRYKPR